MSLLRLIALLLVFAPSLASAQGLLLRTDIQGDLDPAEHDAFRAALLQGLNGDGRVTFRSEADSAPLLGDDPACTSEPCLRAAGERAPAQVAARARIYAEAEIYDFTVSIWDLNSGALLHEQNGECTFCPQSEAVEAMRFVARSAIGSVETLPEPTSGPAAPAPVAAAEPEPEPEPAGPAWETGDITLRLSVLPVDARILVNGQLAGQGSAELRVAPQSLEITFEADGHSSHTESIRLTSDMAGPLFLRIRLDRRSSPAAARAASSSDGFDRRATGGVLVGTGAAALIGGIVLLALDGRSSCASGPFTACPEVYETSAGGISLTAIGALAVGAGTALLITGPSRDSSSTAATPRASGRTSFGFQPPTAGRTSFSFRTSF